MQRIGLIGGMSWESTAEYYRLINTLVAQRLGGLHSAHLLLASVDFAPVEAMQATGDWTAAAVALCDEARSLERAGADFLVLCTNTMHKVADEIENAVDIPLLHLADATAQRVVDGGIEVVGLLGTKFTMEQDFYRKRLQDKGIEVLVPDDAGRADVHRIIYDQLCHGVIEPRSRERYEQVIAQLVDDGAEGVVLGCTEIELLVNPDGPSPVPLFATTRIHAEAAVERALGPREGLLAPSARSVQA